VYNFDLGDEFHIDRIHTYLGNGSGSEEIRKVLMKKETEEGFRYRFSRIMRHTKYELDVQPVVSYVHDTIERFYKLPPNWDVLPEETIFKDEHNIYSYSIASGGINHRQTFNDPYLSHLSVDDSCFQYPIMECGSAYEYLEGCGRYYLQAFCSIFPSYKKLVYYKKGNETWGTPFNTGILVGANHASNTIQASIFPNPFRHQLHIQVQPRLSNGVFKLYNLQGRLMQYAVFQSSHHVLESDKLPSGMYYFIIESDQGIVEQGKIICVNPATH